MADFVIDSSNHPIFSIGGATTYVSLLSSVNDSSISSNAESFISRDIDPIAPIEGGSIEIYEIPDSTAYSTFGTDLT